MSGSSASFRAGDELRELTRGLEALRHLDGAAEVLERVQALAEENEGLAGEVLRSYEQLNVIFEITQQVARLTRAAEIEQVLACRVGTLLEAHTVVIFRPDGQQRCFDPVAGAPRDRQLPQRVVSRCAELIERVRTTRGVSVIELAGPPAELGGQQVILGPLPRLDDNCDVVVAVRRNDGRAFTSGDMLMLDSLLSFGGQIISNSELHEKLSRMSFEVIRALVSAIDKKDHYTCGHSERVGYLARLTGRKLGLSAEDVQTLEWAGLLHDVGKIGVPEEILNKPGRLTAEEFEVIKQHPRMGYEILKPIASFESVLEAVLHHHEAPDGSGYPDRLKGPEIPLFASILHVVDIFDALTSTRSYREAFTLRAACDIIRGDSGTKVDPNCAQALLDVLDEFATQRPREFAQMFPSIRLEQDGNGQVESLRQNALPAPANGAAAPASRFEADRTPPPAGSGPVDDGNGRSAAAEGRP